ncbi:MAG: glycosyltransferase [Desulfarculaceae bacterium]|nr:glycosyltransferase [Desulfarculaceae bacterium]
MSTPLFSIITPTLNRAHTIKEAVRSVMDQNFQSFEHIVVDGCSTDNTLEVLAEFPHLKVISGPDQGLWDALNKGIALSRGEIVGHLNSDDRYLPGAFKKVARVLSDDPGAGAACGGAEIFQTGPNGDRVLYRYNRPGLKEMRLSDITRYVPITNARFFRKEVYKKVGFYNQGYPLAADREFFLRVWLAGIRTAQVRGVVYQYRWHRGSLTIKGSTGLTNLARGDYLKLCASFLAKPDLPEEVRKELLNWRAWELICQSLSQLKEKGGRQALASFWRAIKTDPAAPLRFAAVGLARLPGRGKRGHDAA